MNEDLECPRCGGPVCELYCRSCETQFETVFGVPFMGEFEAEDTLGLIEIAANAQNRENLISSPEFIEQLDVLCAAYHAASDKEAFRANHPEARASYFESRYDEWVVIERLLEGHDLAGRDVLDVGAGQGFASWRLASRGARVTALEFSPILAEAGRKSFPSLRWFGGFSHALPFVTGSFDFVFMNAALHHMRDIRAAIAEALRVLRPGGMLITTSDAFRSEDDGPEMEFSVFDRHEAVLLGVNEQIPSCADFLAVFELNSDRVEPELFTQMIHEGVSGQRAKPG